jgi:hypothetical protein
VDQVLGTFPPSRPRSSSLTNSQFLLVDYTKEYDTVCVLLRPLEIVLSITDEDRCVTAEEMETWKLEFWEDHDEVIRECQCFWDGRAEGAGEGGRSSGDNEEVESQQSGSQPDGEQLIENGNIFWLPPDEDESQPSGSHEPLLIQPECKNDDTIIWLPSDEFD